MSRWRWLGGLLAGTALLGTVAVAAVDVFVNPFFNNLPWVAVLFMLPVLGLRRRARRIAGAFTLAALGWVASALIKPRGPAPVEVLVFGVDGGTFDVIDTFAGELPAFARLKKEGTRAVLRSMEPMFSPLLWTSIASGRGPDEHGIRGFRVQSSDCKVARFWDVAEEQSWRIGLYKWLVDYPPRQVQGFWVPSWLAPSTETWPPELSVVKEVELSRRLKRKQVTAVRSNPEMAWDLVKSGVRLGTIVDAVGWVVEEKLRVALGATDMVRANVRQQLVRGNIDRDVFVRQLYVLEPRLATFNYYATDGLAHLYWDRHVAGGDEVRAAYRQADGILDELRSHLSPDARLIVVSDHGFQPMNGTGLAGNFAPTTERLRAKLTDAVGPVDVTRVGKKLTVAFTDADQRARGEAWLGTLVDGQGAPLFTLGEYPANSLAIALNLANDQLTAEMLATGTVVVGSAPAEPMSDWVVIADSFTGTHEEKGIFYAAGRDVPRGVELPVVEMLQVAPTVLAAMGMPAATNMPGQAVIFPEQPRVESWDRLVLGLTWLGGEAGVNDDRLKQLGYQQ